MKLYTVKATAQQFARFGDRISLDFRDYVRIFAQGKQDSHELSLSDETAAQLARDGYDVSGYAEANAKPEKADTAVEK